MNLLLYLVSSQQVALRDNAGNYLPKKATTPKNLRSLASPEAEIMIWKRAWILGD